MAADDEETAPASHLELVGKGELQAARRKREDERRAEVFSLTLAGYTHAQIADRMKVSVSAVENMLTRALAERPRGGIEDRRDIENARLDRVQATIWADVLKGDHKAIQTWLRISERRSRLNGLDAPMKVDMAISIKAEMEQALAGLEAMVFGGDIVEAEVIRDDAYMDGITDADDDYS